MLQEFFALENALLSEEADIPVYFTVETDEIRDIYEQIKSSSHGIDYKNLCDQLDFVSFDTLAYLFF